ncbi:MAG: alpha/beta family hydrolase [Thermomicrobiales bacterium]
MAEMLELSIHGFEEMPVPNQFLRQQGRAHGLAILLPGLGYTCDMPFFYYTELQFLVGGFDVLRVDYDYRQPGGQAWGKPEHERRLIDDVTAAVRMGVSQNAYDSVTVVGKSLGTLAMAHLDVNGDMPSSWRSVWVTPLLKQDVVWTSIQHRTTPAAVVIGTEDPHYDAVRIANLESRDAMTVVVVEDGNHSLNAGRTAEDSAKAMATVIGQLEAFYDFPRRDADEMD